MKGRMLAGQVGVRGRGGGKEGISRQNPQSLAAAGGTRPAFHIAKQQQSCSWMAGQQPKQQKGVSEYKRREKEAYLDC